MYFFNYKNIISYRSLFPYGMEASKLLNYCNILYCLLSAEFIFWRVINMCKNKCLTYMILLLSRSDHSSVIISELYLMVNFAFGRTNLATPPFATFPNVEDSETNNRPCFCTGVSKHTCATDRYNRIRKSSSKRYCVVKHCDY